MKILTHTIGMMTIITLLTNSLYAQPFHHMTEHSTHSKQTQWVPVATYLSSDQATGQRVDDLLRQAGIRSVSVGSLGTTVSVSSTSADQARRILREAIAREGLRITVI